MRSIPTDLVVADRGFLVRCEERGGDGRLIGEMELGVFAAGLIVDRDGVLEDMVVAAAERAIETARAGRIAIVRPIELDDASGYRAEVELLRASRESERVACPHVAAIALAPADLAMCGGVFLTTRSASPEWPAAEEMLASLRIVTARGGAGPANDEVARALLPIVKRR